MPHSTITFTSIIQWKLKFVSSLSMWGKITYLVLLLTRIMVELLLEFRRYSANAKYFNLLNKSLGFFSTVVLIPLWKVKQILKTLKTVCWCSFRGFCTHQKARFWMISYSISVLCLFLEDWEIQYLLPAEVLKK